MLNTTFQAFAFALALPSFAPSTDLSLRSLRTAVSTTPYLVQSNYDHIVLPHVKPVKTTCTGAPTQRTIYKTDTCIRKNTTDYFKVVCSSSGCSYDTYNLLTNCQNLTAPPMSRTVHKMNTCESQPTFETKQSPIANPADKTVTTGLMRAHYNNNDCTGEPSFYQDVGLCHPIAWSTKSSFSQRLTCSGNRYAPVKACIYRGPTCAGKAYTCSLQSRSDYPLKKCGFPAHGEMMSCSGF